MLLRTAKEDTFFKNI